MATINNFEDLLVWQEARQLSQFIYQLTQKNNFGSHDHLRIQIERSSGSVMDNIAEGFERGSNKEFIQFLYIAKGSCGEVRSQLYRSLDYQIINHDQLNFHISITKKLGFKIFSLINYLKQSPYKGDKYNTASEPTEHYGFRNTEELNYYYSIEKINSSNNEVSNSSNSVASNDE